MHIFFGKSQLSVMNHKFISFIVCAGCSAACSPTLMHVYVLSMTTRIFGLVLLQNDMVWTVVLEGKLEVGVSAPSGPVSRVYLCVFLSGVDENGLETIWGSIISQLFHIYVLIHTTIYLSIDRTFMIQSVVIKNLLKNPFAKKNLAKLVKMVDQLVRSG